jgi:hypothetical protein
MNLTLPLDIRPLTSNRIQSSLSEIVDAKGIVVGTCNDPGMATLFAASVNQVMQGGMSSELFSKIISRIEKGSLLPGELPVVKPDDFR